MAALLCKSIGDLCSCLTVPCTLCCECTGQLLCTPFAPFLIVTFALNLPLVLWSARSAEHRDCAGAPWWLWVNGIMAGMNLLGSVYIAHRVQSTRRPSGAKAAQDHTTTTAATTGTVVEDAPDYYHDLSAAKDDSDQENKHSVNVAEPATFPASVINFVGALMGSQKHTDKDKMERDAPQATIILGGDGNDDDDDGPSGSFQRLGQVMCYDTVVALYLLVAILWILWQSMGSMLAVSFAGKNSVGDNHQCDQVQRFVVYSLICGYVYLMVVTTSFGCSIICLR
jgi:hypothetical protein